jgi:hypothetical protein
MDMYKDYTKKRFTEDKNRTLVWQEISKHIQRYIKKEFNVLDLGSGYCDFINQIHARKKYALDKYINPKKYSFKEIITIFGDSSLMNKKIKINSLDVIFASNFFEHLTDQELEKYMNVIKNKLKINGLLIIIQPNYRLCPKTYFDDYTHVKAWDDTSLVQYLKGKKFLILKNKPRFLPFSLKSKLPKAKFLIWSYLRSPIKPFAKQMLIIAKNVAK